MAAENKYKVVGTRPIRHDGEDKVTGRALYGADFTITGLLHGKVLRSPYAHARIKSIDTSQAEAHPGVKAVITAADMPEVEDGIVEVHLSTLVAVSTAKGDPDVDDADLRIAGSAGELVGPNVKVGPGGTRIAVDVVGDSGTAVDLINRKKRAVAQMEIVLTEMGISTRENG